ncbi:hypothetical protein HOLleu_20864 [Holothuria leucospilota]|uniref:ZU5 domain-containing protein n=1 Tax=Holothuria leucospilota TaxID=206669 RepID=A0A9Q1BWX6_HOLLE|nr:hypothetical protein HOLleu_20864 [Holothuria leucospilota]
MSLLSSQVLPRLTPLILFEPEGLEFIIPVKLTVPHCAVIQEPDHHKVTVEIGHKNRSTKEWAWTEETVDYCLTRKTCSVFLRHFSGVNVNIDSTEEKMLRVIPYAKLTPHSNNVLLTLWFCNDLEADFQSVTKCGENDKLVPLDSYDTFKLRHVEGAESVKVTLKDASNQWFRKEFKDCIGVNSLAGKNQLYRDFRLPTVSDQDNGNYIYLDLRVTQHLGEKESETSFALRKRICDLTKPFSLRRLHSPCENEESILSFQENPTDRCFAVPYIDPMKDHEDDVILTLWLCPFESQREKLQEIETKRIQCGSRAKFQFIGKKEDKDEVKFINLEVLTFQDENHRTPFIEEVDISQLLYGSRLIEVPNAEDLSDPLNQGKT